MASSTEVAIEVKNLHKTYHGGFFGLRTFQALKGISFNVSRGEVFGLLGPNGAGKTTFLKILLGIIRKTQGSATMLGYPAGSLQGRKLVGYLPENLRIPRHLNAFSALEYYGNLSNVPTVEVKERREHLLQMVGLLPRAKDSVKKYSKGMLQRLGLAQALLHQPKLLVLDEPTDGLDPRARAEVRMILRQLGEQGITVFLNSHILQEVEMVCDRVAILDKGQLKYCGSVKEIEAFVRQGETIPQAPSKDGVEVAELVTAMPTRPQLEVSFDLAGSDASLQSVLDGQHPIDSQPTGAGQLAVKMGFADQNEVDQFVDRLRSHQVSIVGLNRRHLSLEDAFLEILSEKSPS